MTRVALAVGASRTDDRFPKNLSAVAPRFSGVMPSSPYDGSQIEYQLLNGGKDFSVTVPAAEAGKVKLPAIEFSSLTDSKP